jgi:hypothetical protein
MNRKFWISAAVMFVMSWALGFLIHGGLLGVDYARLPNLMRPMAEAQGKLPFILLSHVCFALAFTWIYLKGREDRPWLAQGARYGIAVALLLTIPIYLIYHAVMPFPLDLVVKQMILDTIRVVLMGVVLAWLNR